MAKPNPTESKASKDIKSQPKVYLKYSGLAFQMLAIIGVSIWGGYWLDSYLALKVPIFTLLLTIGSMVGIFYKLIRATSK